MCRTLYTVLILASYLTGCDAIIQDEKAKTFAGRGSAQPTDQNAAPKDKNGTSAETSGETAPPPQEKNTTDDSAQVATEIEFGLDEVYHLGNNLLPESSCLTQIEEYAVTGAKFYFDFEVVNDNTVVEIGINYLCGVDYANYNVSNVKSAAGSSMTPEKKLQTTNAPVIFPSLTLAKGNYYIEIVSKSNPAEQNDKDDFLVGKIKIEGSNKIIQGQIRAE